VVALRLLASISGFISDGSQSRITANKVGHLQNQLVLIAIYIFTSVLALAAIGDARLVLSGGLSGAPRIARHLWRMCLGLTLAAGSFFTNALPRLLPPPVHITPIFFLPQLLLLGFLVFWMIRVRFPDRRQA